MALDLTSLAAKPLVYVAGPYRLPDPVENTHNACRVASAIIDTGLANALVPHATLAWHLATPRPETYWLAVDIGHLARCDALYRVVGASSGADGEVEFARSRGIPVFYEWWALVEWLQAQEAKRT